MGYSAGRLSCQRAAACCSGSMSMMPERMPAIWAAAARLMVIVDLPTPPFKFAAAITFAMCHLIYSLVHMSTNRDIQCQYECILLRVYSSIDRLMDEWHSRNFEYFDYF